MNKAVFLDRDGVINRLIFNARTGEYESPHRTEDLELYPYAPEALRKIKDMGFLLFLLSNQPSYAKGKVSLEEIKAIHDKFHGLLISAGVKFADYFYCYHHPSGTVPEFSLECKCRKPKPYFILKAREAYRLDLKASWMIGDRDSDIICGHSAGLKTILIKNDDSVEKNEECLPDFCVRGLIGAVEVLAKNP